MRTNAPFSRKDLRELHEELLDRAECVVAMREIHAGEHHPDVIGLRHDVDNTLEPCLELARWEERHGYRSTYFVLHHAPYWNAPELPHVLDAIASRGHEIGIHANALAVALERGGDPGTILDVAIQRLRSWGHNVTGVVAHGDPLCHKARFVNDEMFAECPRPDWGEPDRVIRYGGRELQLEPRPLADWGLRYESYRVAPRALYLSDSGGQWNEPWDELCARFPSPFGQLHVLVHPCWWIDAFPARVPV